MSPREGGPRTRKTSLEAASRAQAGQVGCLERHRRIRRIARSTDMEAVLSRVQAASTGLVCRWTFLFGWASGSATTSLAVSLMMRGLGTPLPWLRRRACAF